MSCTQNNYENVNSSQLQVNLQGNPKTHQVSKYDLQGKSGKILCACVYMCACVTRAHMYVHVYVLVVLLQSLKNPFTVWQFDTER